MAHIFSAKPESADTPNLLGSLPSLESLTPPPISERKKVGLVFRLLRQAAIKGRDTHPREFYSIRAVARHFSVPVTTVTRFYGQLKHEGILASVWGSRTFIEPRGINGDIRVKAIVGLPASLRLFRISRNYRTFLVSMQEVLWKRGFATRMLFLEAERDPAPMVDSLLADRVDFAVWYAPTHHFANSITRLRDRGIAVVSVVERPPINGTPGYYVCRLKAVRETFVAWRRAGTERVTIFSSVRGNSSSRLATIEMCLQEAGLTYGISESWTAAIRDASSEGQALVFPTSDCALRFGLENSNRLSQSLAGRFVMFAEGDIDLPNTRFARRDMDLIEVDWPTAARCIGNDLVTNGRRGTAEQVIFQARRILLAAN